MRNSLDFWRSTNPLREYGRFMDQFLGGEFPSTAKLRTELQNATFNPGCEVIEDKTGYHLKFDIPGMNKDQIKIDLHDNVLTVSGERKEERKEEGKRYYTEFTYGSFTRSFSFPQKVDEERVEAKYENGILSVNLLKSEGARARQITVK